jgi:hypothetical protein
MAKDNKYYMKRRRYGWGFMPTSWQGWLFLALQLAVLLVAATFLPAKPQQPTSSQLAKYILLVGLVVITIILVAFMVGPKPHWRWGKKDTDNPNEDF